MVEKHGVRPSDEDSRIKTADDCEEPQCKTAEAVDDFVTALQAASDQKKTDTK